VDHLSVQHTPQNYSFANCKFQMSLDFLLASSLKIRRLILFDYIVGLQPAARHVISRGPRATFWRPTVCRLI
jgi:hypothetical protein